MERNLPSRKLYSRRELGGLVLDASKALGLSAVLSYGAALEANEALDMFPTSSEFRFADDQRRLLEAQHLTPGPKSVSLVFGGLNVKNAELLTHSITPELQKFGPVGALNEGANDPNPASIVNEMKKLQDEYGIDEFTFWGNSIGTHIIGEVVDLADRTNALNPYRINRVFADCTPPGPGYGRNPEQEIWLNNQQFQHEPLLPLLSSLAIHGTPVHPNTGGANLFWEQAETAQDQRFMFALNKRMEQDGAKLVYFGPEDLTADPIVDTERSILRMQQIFGDKMSVRWITGPNQNHATAEDFPEPYLQGIREEYELAS